MYTRVAAERSPLYQRWVGEGRSLDPGSRFWEPWKRPGYAEECLKGWGSPRPEFQPRTRGQRGKRHRTARTAKCLRGKTVLDVGCGVGHLFGVLKDEVEDYLGIDSPEMIRVARRCWPEHKDKFQIGDVFDLSGERGWGETRCGTYDTVFSLQVLQHLPVLYEALQEMWNHTLCMVHAVLPLTKTLFTVREDGLISHRYSGPDFMKAVRRLKPNYGRVEIHDVRRREFPNDPKSGWEQAIIRITKRNVNNSCFNLRELFSKEMKE